MMKDLDLMFLKQRINSIFSQKLSLPFALIIGCLALTSCDLSKNHLKMDREKNMEIQDYRDALAPRLPEVDVDQSLEGGSIPPLQPYVAMPDSNTRAMPLVSININQNVPLVNALYQLAEQAEFDVEVDPRIVGSVIFSARNKPFDQVIERLSELAGLRYKMEDDFIRIELDSPYHKMYRVNYLNITRNNSSSIENTISVVSGETAAGSSFSSESTSNSDFWTEVEANIEQIILLSSRNVNALITDESPSVRSVSAGPTTIEPILLDEGDLEGGPGIQVQAPDVNLEVGEVAEQGEEEMEQATEGPQPFDSRFSINRQAGVVSVYAPERVHKKVADYLSEVEKLTSAQVLVEVKVLEVELNDQSAVGVNWESVELPGGETFLGFETIAGDLVRGIIDDGGTDPVNSTLSFQGNDQSLLIQALSKFGTVTALASPRMTVLHNQAAILNVAKNFVFFEVGIEPATNIDGVITPATIEASAASVPEGVIINLTPSIDVDTQTITMAVRPTVTTVFDTVDDPTPALRTEGISNPVPRLNVQEFDTIIKLNNGQAAVLGGLMQDRVDSEQQGVPVLSEIPMFGGLFRRQQDSVRKTELVVFIKATIVENGNTIHSTDKDLYRTFSRDRRPFKL